MTADQVAKWKAAIADLHKRERGRRGKRKTGIERADGPGMVRIRPGQLQEGGDRPDTP